MTKNELRQFHAQASGRVSDAKAALATLESQMSQLKVSIEQAKDRVEKAEKFYKEIDEKVVDGYVKAVKFDDGSTAKVVDGTPINFVEEQELYFNAVFIR